jgi:hypothetical protein
VKQATDTLTDPVIVVWRDNKTGRPAPGIPGGVEDRWHDYGESNAGKPEVTIGDDFHFIFTDAAEFEEPDFNLSSVEETDDTTILCVNNACFEEDLHRTGYYPRWQGWRMMHGGHCSLPAS